MYFIFQYENAGLRLLCIYTWQGAYNRLRYRLSLVTQVLGRGTICIHAEYQRLVYSLRRWNNALDNLKRKNISRHQFTKERK